MEVGTITMNNTIYTERYRNNTPVKTVLLTAIIMCKELEKEMEVVWIELPTVS